MKPLAMLDDAKASAQWQRRREKFVLWNRRWVAGAFLWLGLVAVTLFGAYYGAPAQRAMFAMTCGALFLCGFPVFWTASLSIGKLLRCPRCGRYSKRAVSSPSKVGDVTACPICGTAPND
jgi:hypothetical protein